MTLVPCTTDSIIIGNNCFTNKHVHYYYYYNYKLPYFMPIIACISPIYTKKGCLISYTFFSVLLHFGVFSVKSTVSKLSLTPPPLPPKSQFLGYIMTQFTMYVDKENQLMSAV